MDGPFAASVCQSGAVEVIHSQGAVHMQVTTVGLDLAKNVFQLHGVDAHGRTVLRKRLARAKVLEFFATLPRCLVGPPVPLGTGCVADGAACGGWRLVPGRTGGQASWRSLGMPFG